MPRVVDVTEDSVDVTDDADDGIAEVINVIGDSDDDSEGFSAPRRTDSPPTRFYGYRRGRELGRGASGKVFVCNKKGSPRGFAVKAIDLRRLQLSPNVEKERTALCREVGILKSLPPHRNIVQMVDAFEEGDWYLLVLELVGGGDLYTVLMAREPTRFMEVEATFVHRQLVDGLAFLHGRGIIHRDLKLENVLVALEHREQPPVLYSVKITDFGLSKAVGAGSEARSLVGTRPYTAPEVLKGAAYDFSSDLWCLGVLLYVLLAGRFPDTLTVPVTDIVSQQQELTNAVARVRVSDAARSVLSGLLQLDATKRLSLEDLVRHEWLSDSATEKLEVSSAKRIRLSASPGLKPALAPARSILEPLVLPPGVTTTVESTFRFLHHRCMRFSPSCTLTHQRVAESGVCTQRADNPPARPHT